MRKVILLFILITTVLRAWADGTPTLTAVAPDVVVSGSIPIDLYGKHTEGERLPGPKYKRV